MLVSLISPQIGLVGFVGLLGSVGFVGLLGSVGAFEKLIVIAAVSLQIPSLLIVIRCEP